MADRSKRDELARFLRTRRERLTPEAVGLPTGGRRRTAGLRREEVAVLAGVSPTWYTYLEQGRSIHPSREVIDSLAGVLSLSEDERFYVRTLLEGSHSPTVDARRGASFVDVLRDIVAQYEDGPYPVYMVNHLCDMVAWNRAACEWYDDWGSMHPDDRNFMAWILRAPQARESLVDWESVVRDSVARWRAECAHHPAEEVQHQIDAFAELHPDFSHWWARHEILEHRPALRTFRHAEYGEQALQVLPMYTPELRTFAVMFHIPVG